MALLSVEQKGKRATLKCDLEGNTMNEIKHYAKFSGGTIESIVREALLHAFKADHEFQEWKKNPVNLESVEKKSKPTKEAATGVAPSTIQAAPLMAKK